MTTRVLLAFLALALQSCCGHADPPCASWAGKNDSFTVEPRSALAAADVKRLIDGATSGESCGDALQPSGSQVVAFTTGKLTRESGGDEGCECIPRSARFDLSGFEEIGPPEVIPRTGHDVVFASTVRVSGSGCEGVLSIGVDPNPDSVVRADGGDLPAHALYRSFEATGDLDDCQQLGLARFCADAWSAELRDEQGERVSVD